MKEYIHEDCLELVTQLSDMNCSASISNGIMTLEDGTQIMLKQVKPNGEYKEMKEDKTITLSKHEVVLDRDFVEEVWELAFGHDAWDKGFNDQEVLDKLKQYEAHALKWEEQEGLL